MTDIPTIRLNNGIDIPCMGTGPGGAWYKGGTGSLWARVYRHFIGGPALERKYVDAVAHAFKTGYTLLDYSSSYGDGVLIGKAIRKSGVPRDRLFLTTRISNAAQREHKVKECLMRQLEGFGVDQVDMLMFHWPVPGLFLDTWKEMISLYEAGYCRSLGVANCHRHHLEALLNEGSVVPVINQVEVHPLFTQKDLIDYCHERKIHVEAYTPIARNDDRLICRPLLKSIAAKYNKTPVQIVLRWHIQTGTIPIVRSWNRDRLLEDISVFDFELTPEELLSIDGLNINSRLRYDPDNCDFSVL